MPAKSSPKASAILSCISVVFFLVAAESAPARVMRPSVHIGEGESAWGLTTTKNLSEVIDRQKLGLFYESKETQRLLRRQALEYLSLRNPLRFVTTVCKDTLTNPFCQFEIDRQIKKAALNAPPVVPAFDDEDAGTRVNKVISANELITAEPESLNGLALGTLMHSMRSFDDFAPLKPIAEKALASTRTCYSSSLYTSLGMKSEEFFPDESQIKLTKRLYARAAECANDEPAMRARYRLALITIWQNSCENVEQLLSAVEKSPLASDYHSRSRYWRYQCAEKMGLEDVMMQTREALWKKNQMSFHNIALNGDDARLQTLLSNTTPARVVYRSIMRPDINPTVQAVETLITLHQNALASDFIESIGARLTSSEPEFRLYVAALADKTGFAIPKFKILAALLNDAPRMMKPATLKLYFPLGFYEMIKPSALHIDPLLVLSLIRQESAFNQHALSSVGARGLMQVMPSTARSIASVSSSHHLYDPSTNIHVGTRYLSHRLNYFGGDIERTLAAYNAGSGRVDRWVKRYPGADKILFVDLIPFKETREYVAAILRNHFWYMHLYVKKVLTTNTEKNRKTAEL